MPLNYDDRWNPKRRKERLSNATYQALDQMIESIVASANEPKDVCEVLKQKFGWSDPSSSLGWAKGDLSSAMTSLEEDAAEYLRALSDGLEYLSEFESVPDEEFINALLEQNGEHYRLDGDRLLEDLGDITVTTEDASEEAAFSARYRMREQIGEGGFGVVHRIEKTTKYGVFEFAAKFFDPSSFNRGPNGLERFKREIEVLNKLQHRGIVPILEGGVGSDGRPYYLMPLIRGKNVRDALEDASTEVALPHFVEICRAVEFAHDNNVLHRDIKPSNILIRDSDRQTVVVDFGAAFVLDNLDEKSLTSQNIGSLAYMPPEVLDNPKLRSPQHDVYSIGVTLYEVFARERPKSGDYVSLSTQAESLSCVDTVVQNAIAPARLRYSTVNALRLAIENCMDLAGGD